MAQVKSTESGESVSAHLSGTVKLAFTRMLDGVELTSVGLEFGTAPPLEVFRALREENWLFHHGKEDHPQAARIKRQFLKAFYPDDELWRQKVWEQGAATARRALAALLKRVRTPPSLLRNLEDDVNAGQAGELIAIDCRGVADDADDGAVGAG